MVTALQEQTEELHKIAQGLDVGAKRLYDWAHYFCKQVPSGLHDEATQRLLDTLAAKEALVAERDDEVAALKATIIGLARGEERTPDPPIPRSTPTRPLKA